jgi:putative inorganic carbon (HCO3(-)) transporter
VAAGADRGDRLALIERWYLRGGLFILPLAYTWGTYDPYVLPKLLVARMLVIGLLLLFIARVLTTRAFVVKRTPLDLPLLAFVGSAALSTVFAYNLNVAVFGIYSRYDGLLTILTYALLFWLTVQAVADTGEARKLMWVLLASGYLVAAIAIFQSVSESLQQNAEVPAYGTLGQKNVLGAFLAMVCPLAYGELVAARSRGARVLALNALAMCGIGLYLTFSRSAWIGVGLAAIVVAVWVRRPGVRFAITTALGIVLLTVGIGVLAQAGGLQPERTDLAEFGDRPAVWRASLQLIASRPLLGYGPDTFGLVFPHFQIANLHQQWDKAHAETLQVAATQGVVGLAAYVLLLAAFVRAFWRGRRNAGAAAIFAAWVAYTATLQLNFSTLAAAFPFWVFAAAAMELWGATHISANRALGTSRLVTASGLAGIVMLLAAIATGVVLPYLADTRVLVAVNADYAGRNRDALVPAQQARVLGPRESVYAVEVGNVLFERSDWAGAREAYGEAAALGTYNRFVYRNLALADRNLGRLAEARVAAGQAVELDRFDAGNQALLAQLSQRQS